MLNTQLKKENILDIGIFDVKFVIKANTVFSVFNVRIVLMFIVFVRKYRFAKQMGYLD